MFVTWKRNGLFETALLFAERWRHLTYSNEPNFINNALLVAKEYFHFKLSNVPKRATLACAQCASRTAVLPCSQCASRTEAPSNGLKKYHRRERTNGGTDERTNPHRHVDFLNLIIDKRQFRYPFLLPLLELLSGVRAHLKLIALVISYSGNPKVRYAIVFSLDPFNINKSQFHCIMLLPLLGLLSRVRHRLKLLAFVMPYSRNPKVGCYTEKPWPF